MLRVPTFVGVGRLGLPLVAAATGVALWSTSWAMAMSAPGSAVSVAMPQSAQPVRAGQQVAVTIPSVVFGPADGLTQRLHVGPHHATVRVWLAAGSPAAVATVHAGNDRVAGCRAVSLRPAAVTTLHCTVYVADSRGPLRLTVATAVAGKHFSTSYQHSVGR
ncbi:hypothetical protein acdb102_21410 [Acidothermaceae bacterium B102]|nr:hypothetical protein acdb102_21410 [Acidothermaceae bacterium B102]